MKELKASTKAGQNIMARASKFSGYWLHQIYDKWSKAKEIAYINCWEQYINTENSDEFSICSYNRFGFTCSWVGTLNGENILRYETKDNSYLVWLDR